MEGRAPLAPPPPPPSRGAPPPRPPPPPSHQATPDEIKAHFRRLALRHHPDRSPDAHGAAQRFDRIYKAFAVLSDPEARHNYDTTLLHMFDLQVPAM